MSRTLTVCSLLCFAWRGSQGKANRENNVERHHSPLTIKVAIRGLKLSDSL